MRYGSAAFWRPRGARARFGRGGDHACPAATRPRAAHRSDTPVRLQRSEQGRGPGVCRRAHRPDASRGARARPGNRQYPHHVHLHGRGPGAGHLDRRVQDTR